MHNHVNVCFTLNSRLIFMPGMSFVRHYVRKVLLVHSFMIVYIVHLNLKFAPDDKHHLSYRGCILNFNLSKTAHVFSLFRCVTL